MPSNPRSPPRLVGSSIRSSSVSSRPAAPRRRRHASGVASRRECRERPTPSSWSGVGTPRCSPATSRMQPWARANRSGRSASARRDAGPRARTTREPRTPRRTAAAGAPAARRTPLVAAGPGRPSGRSRWRPRRGRGSGRPARPPLRGRPRRTPRTARGRAPVGSPRRRPARRTRPGRSEPHGRPVPGTFDPNPKPMDCGGRTGRGPATRAWRVGGQGRGRGRVEERRHADDARRHADSSVRYLMPTGRAARSGPRSAPPWPRGRPAGGRPSRP